MSATKRCKGGPKALLIFGGVRGSNEGFLSRPVEPLRAAVAEAFGDLKLGNLSAISAAEGAGRAFVDGG